LAFGEVSKVFENPESLGTNAAKLVGNNVIVREYFPDQKQTGG
jgi:hypothetical protein